MTKDEVPDIERLAREWQSPETLEALAEQWDKLEEYYSDLAAAAPIGYASGSFQGKAIGISICAAQLRRIIRLAEARAQLRSLESARTFLMRCEEDWTWRDFKDDWLEPAIKQLQAAVEQAKEGK